MVDCICAELYYLFMDNNNPVYDDCYFSEEGGYDESLWVFVNGNNLERFSRLDDICAGETGFGTGLNFLALAGYLNSDFNNYSATLDYFSCEKYPLSPEKVSILLLPLFRNRKNCLDEYLSLYSSLYSDLKPGLNTFNIKLCNINILLSYFFGDAEDGLPLIGRERDIWFLDGHDPVKNPDMWSSRIFDLVGEKSHQGTTLSTYTAKGAVKKGLRESGFFIKRRKGYGRKRHMISGVYSGRPGQKCL